MIVKGKKSALSILGFLLLANVLAWIAVFESSGPKVLEVCFFDVGQGDSIFITSPQGHQILVDGGPDSRILEKLAQEMPFYDRSLDLIILSHPERDHMAGLIEVLKKYRVDYILWTGVLRDTLEFQKWQNALDEEKAQIKIAKAGQRIIAPPTDEAGSRVVFDIFHPFDNLEERKFKDSNNTSIVLKLSFGNSQFLFTGDIYQSVEQELIIRENSYPNSHKLASNLLKVAHHGSKTSSCEEFLEKVLPEIAVIQSGKNPYGHPHEQVLERLKHYNVEILRTDELGDIKLISDGTHIKSY